MNGDDPIDVTKHVAHHLPRRRSTALPSTLAARAPAGVIRPVDAGQVYAHPRAQVARLADRGLLHPLARGYYAVVPQEAVGTGWMPTIEAAGAGIGAADYGPDDAVLMGLSAARVHGAVPRALAVAVVAVPKQRGALTLADRQAQVIFVCRATRRLDAVRVRLDLGGVLVTAVEQTVLDLAHRPELGGVPTEAAAAVRALVPRCDVGVLADLAAGQRLRAAHRRAVAWTAQGASGARP